MNSLIIPLIFIIIILSSYLIYRNYQEYNVLEKFSTQSSLSTYFQNTTDSDDYQTYTNTFNGMNVPLSKINVNKPVGWNGLWLNRDVRPPINAQFLQVNDKLIVVLTTYIINPKQQNTDNSNSSIVTPPINTLDTCNNIFIGVASLNKDKKIFRITDIICDSLTVPSLGIGNKISDMTSETVYFTGKIDTSGTPYKITLYPNSTTLNTTLELTLNQSFVGFSNEDYPQLSKYMKQISPFLQENPILPKNDSNKSTSLSLFEYTVQSCPANTSLCKDTTHGLNDLTYLNDDDFNACCNNDTNKTTNCFLNTRYIDNDNSINNIPECSKTSNLNYYNNYNAQFYLMGTSGNSLNLCNLLNYFSISGHYAVLCYVTNLKNVQSLNYQFFGIKPNESSLTLQYDMTNQSLQSSLSNNNPPTQKNKGLSFTNCLEMSNSTTPTTDCISKVNEYITNNILPTNVNNSLLPTIWEINSKPLNQTQSFNYINSCPFTLKTSSLYNSVQPKYVECNDNGTTNLSLYGGGNNQNLYMQDTTLINDSSLLGASPNKYYAVTANIRANNGLYLVPSNTVNGFYNNSTHISLKQSPEPNGKWLILGFTITNNLSELNDIIKKYTF